MLYRWSFRDVFVILSVLLMSLSNICLAAEPKAKHKPIPPPPPPPEVAYVISEMTATGAIEGELAKFQMALKVESLNDGIQRVRLFATPVAISEVKSYGFWAAARLMRTADGIDLVVEKKGKYDVSLTFVQKVGGTKKEPQLVLPMPPAVKSKMELTIPVKDIEVKTEPEVGVETKPLGEKATLVTIYGGAANQVTLRWLPKAPEKKVEAIVFADQGTILRVGRGTLRIESTIDYSILQGKVDRFRIRIPEKSSLLSVECKDMRNWEVEEKGGERVARIDLIGEADKSAQVMLKLEQPLEKLPMTFDAPKIEPLDVAREGGHIAVAGARGLQVEPKELKDISQVDVRELPASLQKTGEEIHLGFRYLKRPFALTLASGEVVAKVSAETSSHVRASLENLRLSMTIKYAIRDAGVFSFQAQLPQGLRLVDVQGENINNWQVDPKDNTLRVDLRAKAENTYDLKLEAEADVKNPQGVELPTLTLMNVERERGFITVSSVPGMRVDVARVEGINQIDVKEIPPELLQKEATVDLAFRYIKPGYRVALNITPLQPEVEATVQTLVTVEEKELTLETQIDYAIRRAGLFQIKLKVPQDLKRQAVEGKDVDDESYDEAAGILTVSLKQKQEGQYSLKLSTQKEIADILKGLDVPVISTVDTKKERGFIALRMKASYRLKRAEGKVKNLDDIDVSELPQPFFAHAQDVALAFKYVAPPWSLGLAVERVEPRVIAEVFNFVTIGENLLQVSATAKYDILHAGVDTFKLKLPPDVTNVDIDGEAIKRRDEDKKQNTWTITLQAKKTGPYRLYATFQRKLEKSKMAPTAPKNTPLEYLGAQALDVERETGYVAVASRADVELTLPEKGVANLTPIDEREIPRDYMQGITLPILMAFKYIEHPYSLKLESRTNDPAEVTVALIESCKLETTVTTEGNMITDLVAYARNSRQQYLELGLPEGAEIWHAFVAGEPVTPFQEKRSVGDKSATITKLPIARAGKSQEAFEVRIRFSLHRTNLKPLGLFGVLDLECPRMNIGIMRLGWTLALPQGYDIIRDTGNLTRIERPEYFEYQLQSISADASYAEMKRVAAAGWETGRPSALNAQAISNLRAIQQLDQQKAAGAPGALRATSMQSIYTGKKPDLPNKFYFQSLILSTDKPARICAQYVKVSLGMPGVVALVAVIAVLCYGGWRRSARSSGVKFAGLLVIALVALGVRTLAEGSYSILLGAIFWTVLAAAVVMGLSDVLRAIQAARRQA
jgi:hypothetical protein